MSALCQALGRLCHVIIAFVMLKEQMMDTARKVLASSGGKFQLFREVDVILSSEALKEDD